jgi:hypothetical protein
LGLDCKNVPFPSAASTCKALNFCFANCFVARSVGALESQYFEATPVGSHTVSYVSVARIPRSVCLRISVSTMEGRLRRCSRLLFLHFFYLGVEDVSIASVARIPRSVCLRISVSTMGGSSSSLLAPTIMSSTGTILKHRSFSHLSFSLCKTLSQNSSLVNPCFFPLPTACGLVDALVFSLGKLQRSYSYSPKTPQSRTRTGMGPEKTCLGHLPP